MVQRRGNVVGGRRVCLRHALVLQRTRENGSPIALTPVRFPPGRLRLSTSIAKEHGFDIHDLFGRKWSGKGTRGKVAVKYRDGAGNTWTGRGRMPRWMVAATKGGKA